jgi:acetyltransferase-like isoleucine patch superfamily enzyme
MLKRLCRCIAHRHGRGIGLYLAVCQPSGEEWAAYLRRHGGLHAMGEDCSIQTNVTITDPAYVTLGDNVRLSGCTLFGHDGVVNMLNRAYGRKIDRVGRIRIGNHVFIGHDCVVMPDVTIGDCVVVATNSVVTSDLDGGFVYAGSPARPIGRVDQLVEKLQRDSDAYPWAPLIATRHGGFDAAMEPVLKQMRVAHFYQG